MFIDSGNTTLKWTRLTGTGDWTTVATVNGASGSFLSMDFNTSGKMIAAYKDSANTVKYFESTDGSTWSAAYAVAPATSGEGLTVKINPSTGKPAMAYFKAGVDVVQYASCSSAVGSCSSGGWTRTTVDSFAGTSTLATSNFQLLSTGLVFTSDGSPVLIYPRGRETTGSLMIARYSGGSFSVSTLVSGSNGTIIGTGSPAALNFGVAGWNAVAGLNSANDVTAVFINAGDWLSATSCSD
jgi:hypothetical protein